MASCHLPVLPELLLCRFGDAVIGVASLVVVRGLTLPRTMIVDKEMTDMVKARLGLRAPAPVKIGSSGMLESSDLKFVFLRPLLRVAAASAVAHVIETSVTTMQTNLR